VTFAQSQRTARRYAVSRIIRLNVYTTLKNTNKSSAAWAMASVATRTSAHSHTIIRTLGHHWYTKCLVTVSSTSSTLRLSGAHSTTNTTKLSASTLTTGKTSDVSLTYSDTVHLNCVRFDKLALLLKHTSKGFFCKVTAPKAMAGNSSFSILLCTKLCPVEYIWRQDLNCNLI
jgi:hypothetical protein